MPPEFEQLVQENEGRIRRIAQRYAAAGGADDLMQEILMQLWRSYRNFRGEAKAETWVYRVALNVSMTQLRKIVKERDLHNELAAQTPANEGAPAGACQADILTGFLNSLGDIDASLLMMYLDGLTAKEMAEVLGIQDNAVNVRINRMK